MLRDGRVLGTESAFGASRGRSWLYDPAVNRWYRAGSSRRVRVLRRSLRFGANRVRLPRAAARAGTYRATVAARDAFGRRGEPASAGWRLARAPASRR